jgi:hypothetical protein
MSSEAREARDFLAPLRERPVVVSSDEQQLTRRERVLVHLRAQVRDIPRMHVRTARRRWLAAAGGLAAAAGVALLVTQWAAEGGASAGTTNGQMTVSALSGRVVHVVEGVEHPLSAGSVLGAEPRGELRTASRANVSIEAAAGLQLDLQERSKLGLSELDAGGVSGSVHLSSGQVRCSVPSLPSGEHFSVITPDARVVVHGTVFSVEVRGESVGDTKTCVRVTDGVVVVHRAAAVERLEAGNSSGCELPAVAEEDQAPVEEVATPGGKSPRPERVAPPVPAPRAPVKPSTLAEENRLLQSALAAEARGEHRAAEDYLRSLLTNYPKSPLAQDAEAALRRVRQRK